MLILKRKVRGVGVGCTHFRTIFMVEKSPGVGGYTHCGSVFMVEKNIPP